MDKDKTADSSGEYAQPEYHKFKIENRTIFLDGFKVEGVTDFRLENVPRCSALCRLVLTMHVEFPSLS